MKLKNYAARLLLVWLLSSIASIAARAEETIEIDRIEKSGFKLTLPADEEWKVADEGYYADEFGGSYQVAIDHGGNKKKQVARIIVISAKPGAMGAAVVGAWAMDHVLGQTGSGSEATYDKAGYLWWYSEKRGFDTGPQWTESAVTLTSGQSITVLSTPGVVINGNKRQMKAAYAATSTGWHTFFVFNVGKNESFNDEWQMIVEGLALSDSGAIQ